MPPKIHFGVNLNFAKFVYGRKRAIDIARRSLGLRCVEMVSDSDFGAVFYLRSPEAFREYHYEVADHAETQGVRISGVFTVYRETGAIANQHPEVRESAYEVGLSMIEQAACYRADYFGAALFTMNQETAVDPEQYQSQFYSALELWKLWMADACRLGVPRLLIERAAAYREGCSTIEETRGTLKALSEFHEKNPDTTVPVGICYDTGHGISRTEDRDDMNRDFRSWLGAFPEEIHAVHLKNTDPEFLETWHFGHEGGIIQAKEVVEAIRDTLTVTEVFLHLEVPGKRGREIGEKRAIEEHIQSIEIVQEALKGAGYSQDAGDCSWNISQ